MEHAEKEKESLEISTHLNRTSLGLTIHGLWGGKVKRVKRGPRAQQKIFCLNIARKQNPVLSCNNDLTLDFEDMAKGNSLMLPNGWFKIVDNPTKISYVHPESTEFENQRIFTEISMEMSTEKGVVFCIKSHGSEISLGDLKLEKILGDLPIKVQAETVLKLVESSAICLGCRFPGDTVISLLPNRVGVFKSLNEPETPPQTGAFSSDCKVIGSSGKQCSKCAVLKKTYQKKKERKEKRTSINKYCNKRYLTKEEIQQQLIEERKLQKKLQDQRECNSSESEDDDSTSQDSDPEKWVVMNSTTGLTLQRV